MEYCTTDYKRHNTFGGLIYEGDFIMPGISIYRIVNAMNFDQQCKKNALAKNKGQKNKKSLNVKEED